MKPLVIYHADCTDGYGAAFAAWLKLGDEAAYVPAHYNKDLGDLLAGWALADREVYILDFSFPREMMKHIFANAKRVVWLDHHKTAFEMWCHGIPAEGVYRSWEEHPNQTHYTLLDNNKSGALLAWEYFHPNTEVPMLIQHIDDRDRWQWKLDGSAEIHAALSSYQPWSFGQWCQFLPSYGGSISPLIREGSAIIRAQKQHIERMAKQVRECWIKTSKPIDLPGSFLDGVTQGWQGLAVNASLHQSEVGHELANQSGTYGLVWYVGADSRVRCSLRSNGDYDVSCIARSFGGGGHLNASGFETDIETLMSWLK